MSKQTTPPGYVLVPREPTEAMAEAGSLHTVGQLGVAVMVWREMVKAAEAARGKQP